MCVTVMMAEKVRVHKSVKVLRRRCEVDPAEWQRASERLGTPLDSGPCSQAEDGCHEAALIITGLQPGVRRQECGKLFQQPWQGKKSR
jgi:hypothetical protein